MSLSLSKINKRQGISEATAMVTKNQLCVWRKAADSSPKRSYEYKTFESQISLRLSDHEENLKKLIIESYVRGISRCDTGETHKFFASRRDERRICHAIGARVLCWDCFCDTYDGSKKVEKSLMTHWELTTLKYIRNLKCKNDKQLTY